MAAPETPELQVPPGSSKATPGVAASPPAQATSPDLLKHSDVKGLRKRIYDHTFEAIQNLQPVSNTRYSLAIENPRWADPETWSPSHQKKVFYQGGTLARRIQGEYVLRDVATQKEISRKRSTIAAVPHLNDRGLFLLNGSHWHLGSQTRLDPGIYPKIQDDGEIKAMVNPKGGRQHSLVLDPESNVFHFELGSSRIPLMPVLRALGVDNKRFHDEWGRDLVEKNAAKADPALVRKLVDKLYDGDKVPEGMSEAQLLLNKFGSMKMDPYVTKQTIGHSHEGYDADAILRTTKRLLALSRGEEKPSERDHQAFQHILGQEHLFAERARGAKSLLNQALWKATHKGNLDHMQSGLLNQHLAETITATGLGVNAQMTNPAEMLDAAYRVSKMGVGGVRSLDAVPDSMRDVHSSQFFFVDPIVTPESGKAGVDSRFAAATARDKEGRIYTEMRNHDGSPRWVTARDIKGMTIAPWESRNSKSDWVEAIRDGEMTKVPKNKVDVYAPPTELAFSPVANMVPFKSASPAHRTAMGARMITQALPLIGGESPHVQSGTPFGGSFEHHYGKHFGALRAEQAGKVIAVTPDAIKVKYMNGETADIELHKHDLYDHAPGRKTHFTQTPMVKPGDFFKPDQLLAKSNYTDDQGRVALGMNFRVGWLPARNAGNFEDAFAFSESAAKRMSSDHMALHSAEEPGMKFGKNNYRSLFPTTYTPEQLKNLDDNGVVKPGAIIKPGQPIVLATRESKLPRTTLVRSPKPIHQDVSEVWDHDYPGEVVDVVKTKAGYRVSVKSAVPMQDADKVSGRHGNKGIITIVPDHEMPVGEDGKPLEVLVSPYSLPSRKNTSQVAELLLGKIAAKHGKKYELPDFQTDDLQQYVSEELKKHGMKDTETLTDPVTGSKIPNVLTGSQFLMKLHHLVETKLKHRDTGGYDSFGTPAKGGEDGAKRMSQADTFALLAHRATAFLRGSQNVRGQRSEHFWEAVLSGYTPPTPGVSNQYRRLIEGLKASGIHPVNENGKLRLKALVDKDVEDLAGDRELKNPGGIDWAKGGDPVPGGLFDKTLHGEDGSKWSRINLHTPMPNPAFEDAIRYTLGLTEKQMRSVLAGHTGLAQGKHHDPSEAPDRLPRGYATGPEAIHDALRAIDMPREMAKTVADIQGNKKTKRDEAIRKYKFLKGAERQGLHPADWMMKAMPVLPPNLRPVSRLEGSNTELVSDPNYLYADLFHANRNLRELSSRTRDVSDERLALYDSMKAVSGLGDPINPKHEQKGVKGLMRLILGESPKWSLPQHKLLSTPVDLVGRSTVGPDASLDMDEVGIPEDMAFKVYKRFVERKLVRNGMSPVEAVRSVREKAPEARRALMQEMETRPVSYHRAPVLHKYGHIGGWPRLVKGDVIKVSPFVIKGLGMDFDGNCCVGSTKITLEIHWGVAYNSLSRPDNLAAWEGFKMRLVQSGQVVLERDSSIVVVRIDDFPRLGPAVKDTNGADVYLVPDGVRVLSYDHKNCRVSFEPVTRFTVDKQHPCHLVTTARGKTVEVSSNESLVAFNNETGDIEKIKPADCVGRQVPTVRSVGVFGDYGDRDLGWWYGCLVADGWVSSRTVGYSKSDPVKREEFLRLTKKLFGDCVSHEYLAAKVEGKYADSAKIHVNNKQIAEIVESVYEASANPEGRGALRKKLPDSLLARGSRECLFGLLSGLLDGDAFVGWTPSKTKPQFFANLYTSSPYLVEDLVYLGCRLGIRCSVSKTPARNNSEESFTVCLSTVDLKKVAAELFLIGGEASKALEEFIASEFGLRETRDSVPITAAQAKLLADGCRSHDATLYSTCRAATKSYRIGRESAQRALAFVQGTAPELDSLRKLVANVDIVWDIYESAVETKAQDVFDLEIPTTKVFAVHNGLVIYDTANIHVPVYDKEIEDIRDRMMPSRNLLSAGNFGVHYKPEREFHVGLWQATSGPGKEGARERVFDDVQALRRAFARGEIGAKDKVTVMKH